MLLAVKEKPQYGFEGKKIIFRRKGVSLTVVKHYKLCQYNMIMLMIMSFLLPHVG